MTTAPRRQHQREIVGNLRCVLCWALRGRSGTRDGLGNHCCSFRGNRCHADVAAMMSVWGRVVRRCSCSEVSAVRRIASATTADASCNSM